MAKPKKPAGEAAALTGEMRRLGAALAAAEAASAAKSRLLATVSHEMRTPLNGVLGLAGVLMETSLTPEQETFVRAMRTSGELLLGLVDDMLDFAKIEAGRFALDPAPHDPEAIVQDVVELMATRAHAKGLDIAAYVAPSVAAPLRLDGPRLRQILLNLVGNAVKFTEEGGVGLVLEPRGEGLSVSVEDSGPGIGLADRERIFREFEQVARGEGAVPGGSGLGLAITRELVRRMGGEIGVVDRPGGGSVFHFSFTPDRLGDSRERRPAGALAGRRALILAPEGFEAAAMARMLADAGGRARIVPTPFDAASLAAAAAAAGLDYDLALIDPRIGESPALLLARLRQAAGRHLPASILIEPGQRHGIDGLKAAGYDAYLVRPVRRASLLRIAEAMAGSQAVFQPDPGDERPKRHVAAPRRGAGLNVLLAEDNEINALLVRAVLERLGHRVTEVHDGRRAVAAATRPERFDVILIDINMPEIDGLGATRAIRAHERENGLPPTPIIAITADARPEMREACRASGMDEVLEKPVDPATLRRALGGIARQSAA